VLAADLALALDPAGLMRLQGLEPDDWQASVLRSESRRQLLLAARQSGKSSVSACLALHQALYVPGSLVLILAPSLRQSSELFRKVAALYGALGQTVPADSETALQLRLTNGSRILSLPGKEATVRGFSGVALLVVDEAARVPDELYFSVRPMLAVSGGRLVALSTPFGKRGWFHDEWESGREWQRTKITADQCPRISPEFLEEERAALGDWWYAQEYDCQFVDTTDQVFAYDLVMAATRGQFAPLFGGEL
jgi:hypothetical protein